MRKNYLVFAVVFAILAAAGSAQEGPYKVLKTAKVYDLKTGESAPISGAIATTVTDQKAAEELIAKLCIWQEPPGACSS